MRDTVPPSSDSGGPSEAGGLIPFAHQKWTLDTIKIFFDSRLADFQKYYSDLLSIQEQTNRDRFTSAEKAVYAALAASDKAISAAMQSSKEAIIKAEAAADKRFDSLNELRAAMLDQQKNFAPATGTDLQFKALGDRITELKESLTARLDSCDKSITEQRTKAEAKGQAMSQTSGIIFSILGVAGVVVTILLNAFR